MGRGTARTPFRRVGPGAGVLTGARTREVTSLSRCVVQHTPDAAPALLRIPARHEVVHNGVAASTAGRQGLPPRTVPAARSEHGRETNGRPPVAGGAEAGTDGGRAGIDGPAARAGARAGARDAVRRCARRCAGRAHRPGAAGRNRRTRRPTGRRWAGHRRRGRHRLHLAVAAGPGGGGGVPGADAPLRPGSPRRGSGCGGGRRRARLRPGHRGVRRGSGGPRRGVGPAPGRPADHLRTGGRGRHAGDVGRGGNRAGLGRRRSPGVPGGLPALGRAARAGQLPRPAPAAHAAARAAVAGARPALSGRARRAGRAAGRRAGRAAG